MKLGNIQKQIILTIFVSFGSVTYGLHSGWLSPMQELLQSDKSPIGRALTDDEITWIAVSFTIAGFCLGLVHIYTADAFGRKISLLIIFIAQVLSWALLIKSIHIAAIIAARVCVGFSASGYFVVGPMYIKEICQDNLRGTLVTFCIICQYLGILVVYLMGGYLGYDITTWVSLGFSIITTISFVIIAPETPPFLVKKEKLEEATTTLAALKGLDVNDKIVQDEMEKIKSQDLYFRSIPRLTFRTIFMNKAWRRGFMVCTSMLVFLNLNGGFSIITYAHSIMAQSGATANPKLQTLFVPILMIIGSIVPLTCVDRMGRKPLLVGSFVLCGLGQLVLASSLLMTEHGIAYPGFLPVLGTAGAVFAYSMGIVPMPLILMAEMFKFEVRAKLSGIVMVIAFGVIFLQLHFTGWMSKVFDTYSLFYIFAVVNGLVAVFVAVFVPETKAKTPEEIEDLLLGRKPNTVT